MTKVATDCSLTELSRAPLKLQATFWRLSLTPRPWSASRLATLGLTSRFIDLVRRLGLDLGNLIGLAIICLLSHRIAPNVEGLSPQTRPHSFSFIQRPRALAPAPRQDVLAGADRGLLTGHGDNFTASLGEEDLLHGIAVA